MLILHVYFCLLKALGPRLTEHIFGKNCWSLWKEHRDMVNHALAIKGFLLEGKYLCSHFIDESKPHAQNERSGMYVNRLNDSTRIMDPALYVQMTTLLSQLYLITKSTFSPLIWNTFSIVVQNSIMCLRLLADFLFCSIDQSVYLCLIWF